MTHRSRAPKQPSWSFIRSRFRMRRAAADELFMLMDDVVAGRGKEQPSDHVAPEILATAYGAQEELACGPAHLDESRQQRIWEDIMSATSPAAPFPLLAPAGSGQTTLQGKPARIAPGGHFANPVTRPFVNIAFAVVLVVAIIGGAKAWLGGGGGEPPQSYQLAAPANPETSNATLVGPTVPANCPVTIPNGSVPPFGNLGFFPGPVFHGENGIWASFGADGTVAWSPDMNSFGGNYGIKFLWFHDERARGHLQVSGAYLGGNAPPLVADVPSGYPEVGYQASGLGFSRLGCWRITAEAGGSSMTFTIWLYEGEPKSMRSDWTSPTPPSYCHVTRQPSSGVDQAALNEAPAGTIAVGSDQIVAFVPVTGAAEVTYKPGERLYPWQGFELHWWQNRANEVQPLIGGERVVGYGGAGNIDYDIGAVVPTGQVTTPITLSSPGCWQIEARANQVSVTFTVWLWTKELPPLATPVATPAGE